jgi:hypothetical protein
MCFHTGTIKKDASDEIDANVHDEKAVEHNIDVQRGHCECVCS